MSQVQTLGAGTTPSQRWARLGGTSGAPILVPPERMKAIILGFPNHGKSDFLWSNPNAFIFNLDQSSMKSAPKAQVWPYSTANGVITGDGSTPLNLTFKAILDKIEILKELARTNQPRPETIVIDSVGALIPLMQRWIIEKAGKSDWKQVDGRAGWGEIYDWLSNSLLYELHSLGYGVWLTGHLYEREIKISDEITERRVDINLSDALYDQRFIAQFEFAGVCEKVPTPLKVQDPRFPNDPKRTIDKMGYRVQLTDVTSHTALNRGLKCRVDLPGPITLPRGNGWSVFREEYLRAASTPIGV